MMKSQTISKKESKYLVLFALLTLVLSLLTYTSEKITDYNNSIQKEQEKLEKFSNNNKEEEFTVYYIYNYRSFYRKILIFLTFLSSLCLIWNRKSLIATFSLVISQLLIVYWLLQHNHIVNRQRGYLEGTPHLLKLASIADYAFFTSVLILLLWQISILFRMLWRTNSRNEILP